VSLSGQAGRCIARKWPETRAAGRSRNRLVVAERRLCQAAEEHRPIIKTNNCVHLSGATREGQAGGEQASERQRSRAHTRSAQLDDLAAGLIIQPARLQSTQCAERGPARSRRRSSRLSAVFEVPLY
jgi:hypothetical protein